MRYGAMFELQRILFWMKEMAETVATVHKVYFVDLCFTRGGNDYSVDSAVLAGISSTNSKRITHQCIRRNVEAPNRALALARGRAKAQVLPTSPIPCTQITDVKGCGCSRMSMRIDSLLSSERIVRMSKKETYRFMSGHVSPLGRHERIAARMGRKSGIEGEHRLVSVPLRT